ncbi:hypothetical protein [Nitrospira sp. Ecomares 2.1]
MKSSLAEDDAQICPVPNVAWAIVNAGHQVTILADASAVTSVAKGFGWFRRLVHSDTTALDRAKLPERERISLADHMGVLDNNSYQGHIDPQARCILEALGQFKKVRPARPQSFLRAERNSST